MNWCFPHMAHKTSHAADNAKIHMPIITNTDDLEAWQTRRRGNGPTAARPKKAAFAVPCALATSTAETTSIEKIQKRPSSSNGLLSKTTKTMVKAAIVSELVTISTSTSDHGTA
mmetsp:Transcript_13354/g.19562  ORF Transcript_13354/g.19562 Transcript_13354/m.19562 type:complete len:114 (-) Transcript_13354:280-621(-)